MLPNLLIIGVPKAGTTSLFSYLNLHKEVFGSSPKEPGYFHPLRWGEELSAITLRRTWTQIGLELGYDTNILNVLSGRSKNLGTKTALGSYTSANLKMAVSFYEQIIDRIS